MLQTARLPAFPMFPCAGGMVTRGMDDAPQNLNHRVRRQHVVLHGGRAGALPILPGRPRQEGHHGAQPFHFSARRLLLRGVRRCFGHCHTAIAIVTQLLPLPHSYCHCHTAIAIVTQLLSLPHSYCHCHTAIAIFISDFTASQRFFFLTRLQVLSEAACHRRRVLLQRRHPRRYGDPLRTGSRFPKRT